MTFYHGTDEERWEAIQKEGVLWGRRYIRNDDGTVKELSRCTYLATTKLEAMCHGTVVLQVEYDPVGGDNNYCKGCWQTRVYEPIPLSNVTKIR